MTGAEILTCINDPKQLEKLYRENKATFKREFNTIYPGIQEKPAARVWYERLNFEGEEISWGTGKELGFVLVLAFFAGLVAKVPHLVGIREDFFYPRNLSFIVFPFLTAYFLWKQGTPVKGLGIAAIAFVVSFFYINSLPDDRTSHTLILACIHLPIFLWAVLGFTFVDGKLDNYRGRLDFLRFNGDLVVMTGLILIAGGVLSAITVGLFELIGLRIEKFYFDYVAIWGLAAAPIMGTYLVRTNPALVDKVSPVIAKIFTPLVLVMLVIYLVAVMYTGKDPYNDRDFLLMFNVLLIGVMAIILFSITENARNSDGKIGTVLLFALSVVTIVVNSIALSAIVFRISEWGITPNRLAVLGGNLLILTNLLIVTYRLFRAIQNRNEIERVEKSIAAFLPFYVLWTAVVAFIFPVVFQFI